MAHVVIRALKCYSKLRPRISGGSRRTKNRAESSLWCKTSRAPSIKVASTALTSPSSVFRYLSAFHDPQGAADREQHKAFIPAAGEHLRGLAGSMRI
jgi:hypothetical protein